MIDLALAGGGQGRAVDVGQGPVHVPFQILDGAAAQHLLQLLPEGLHHLLAAQVQVVLAADLAGLAARHRKGPVRVGAVQIAVGADRLRLDPKAQAQVHGVEFGAQAGQAVGQLGPVRSPVAQAGGGAVAPFEPAVVQHEQVDVRLPGRAGQGQQLCFVKVEVAGLPAVQQHRARGAHILPAGRQQTGADGVVEAAAHLAQALVRMDHGGLGGGKAGPGLQLPVEVVGMDAHHQPLAGVGALGLDQEVAAVHQGKAPAGARRLGAVGGAEDGGGIVGVAGDAPGAADALDAPAQGRALGGALGRPGAVQGDQVHGARGKVQAEGGRLVQRQQEGRGVGVDRGPGDQVLGLVDRVPQLHFQPKDVPQGEGQGLDPVSVPEGGQPRQGRFACGRLRLHKGRLGGLGAVGKGGDAGGRAVVGCAGGRPLSGCDYFRLARKARFRSIRAHRWATQSRLRRGSAGVWKAKSSIWSTVVLATCSRVSLAA